MLTRQEVFDKIAAHLLKQNKPCTKPGFGCLYHGPDGTACAAGCLIPKDVNTDHIEGKGITYLASDLPEFVATHMNIDPSDRKVVELISELQELHDECPPGAWSEGLAQIADSNKLSTAVLS